MAKQATEVALKTGLEQARLRAHQLTIDILRAAKQAAGQGQGVPQSNVPGELQTPPSLQLLPLYAMSLMKSLALRGGQEVRLDERAFYLQLCANMSIEDSKVFIFSTTPTGSGNSQKSIKTLQRGRLAFEAEL